MLTKNIEKQEKILGGNRFRTYSKEFKNAPVGADSISAQNHKENTTAHGITLIALAISRKCVRYEERAWKPCERREKERKV